MNRSSALRPPKAHQIYQPPEEVDDGFKRFIVISIVFHLLLLAIFTLRAVFYPNEPLMLERAIRVDMVGLPEKTKALPPAVKEILKETPPAPKPEPKPVEEAKPEPVKPTLPKPVAKPETNKVNLNQAKQKQESALKRLEALQKLESEVNEAKAREAHAKAQAQPVRGNQVSPGSALTGIARIENDNYLTSIDEHVKRYWDLPNFLARANLSASVIVYLDQNGAVVKKVLARPSGNDIFDETVMASIDKASPFPPPPARLVNVFMVDGIQLGFPD